MTGLKSGSDMIRSVLDRGGKTLEALKSIRKQLKVA